jgi:hypothetical protein
MSLIDYDPMVEKVSATAYDPAFRNPIPPGTAVADLLWLNTAGNQEVRHIFSEFCITI